MDDLILKAASCRDSVTEFVQLGMSDPECLISSVSPIVIHVVRRLTYVAWLGLSWLDIPLDPFLSHLVQDTTRRPYVLDQTRVLPQGLPTLHAKRLTIALSRSKVINHAPKPTHRTR
jgi:hypothetical protein